MATSKRPGQVPSQALQPKPQIFEHRPASTIKGAIAAANAHVSNVHANSK